MTPFRSKLRATLCAGVESALLMACLAAVEWFRLAIDMSPDLLSEQGLAWKAPLTALVFQLCMYYADFYEEAALRPRTELYLRLAEVFVVGGVAVALASYAFPALEIRRGVLAAYLPLAMVSVAAWRMLYFWALGREALSDRVLILGTGQSAQQIGAELVRRAPLGFRVVGFIGEKEAEVGQGRAIAPVRGTSADLLRVVEEDRVGLIVVAVDDRRGKLPVADLMRCRLNGIRVEEFATFFERITGRIHVKNLRPSWFVFGGGFNRPRLSSNAKRLGEFLVALTATVLLSPLLTLLALVIKLDSRGPVLYRQDRVGERGRIFGCFKFRTMSVDAEVESGPVWATAGPDPRITRVGRILRKLRLDELPQLLNVLRGEMSFVGPRPERPHFVEMLRKVIPFYDERHTVRPGITGWAQIKYGYGGTIEDAEQKLQYDLYYVRHMSLVFDAGILLDTFKVMLMGKGAR